MGAEYCFHSGKIRHKTMDEALDHARGLKVRGQERRHRGRLHAYQCDRCLDYHVGHDRRTLPRRRWRQSRRRVA
jgi:hypothetical protein